MEETDSIIIIKDGEGEIPKGKRLVPDYTSLTSFDIPDKKNGGLERAVLKNISDDSAQVCIVKTVRTYTREFPKASASIKYTLYAALYCGLEDDPEYAR